jgi:FG-GAP repeat
MVTGTHRPTNVVLVCLAFVVTGLPRGSSASAGHVELVTGLRLTRRLLAHPNPWRAHGDERLDDFGWAVATAGDVNGDGYADVMVGASYHDGRRRYDVGRALEYEGSELGLGSTARLDC